MTPLELLAPARNADIGIAAIRCGADAVYIGGPAFGARVSAGNPVEEILRLCKFASAYGAKIFVTVNTLCRDNAEREQLAEMMLELKGKGISAFIMQDSSMLPVLARYGYWDEEFHASTQCAIRTPERAKELVQLGFSRLILERELSLEQIRAIKQAVPDTDIECFVHGALCVCYSGDCYLSEYLTGRSANRGECAQPCRNNYDLTDGNGTKLCSNKPLLSLKDYCLIDKLPQLADAGVISFKIEGRLKGESYVKNVVRAYSLALDRLVARSGGRYRRSSLGRVTGGFEPDLTKTFNRSYTSLFIDGKRGEWHSGDAATSLGEFIGRVHSIGRDSSITLELERGIVLHNGDGLCTVGKSRVSGFRADKVEGNRVFCKSRDNIRTGDRIWRNLDMEFERRLESCTPQRVLDVKLDVSVKEDRLHIIALREDGCTIVKDVDTSAFDKAVKVDRMLEIIRNQLGKNNGVLCFEVASLTAECNPPMAGASFLNEIRRQVAEEFENLPVAPAVKLQPRPLSGECIAHLRREGELMRTKYCIRYRMGLCPKQGDRKTVPALFLENNGKRIPLMFDCRNCEMVLLDPRNQTDGDCCA